MDRTQAGPFDSGGLMTAAGTLCPRCGGEAQEVYVCAFPIDNFVSTQCATEGCPNFDRDFALDQALSNARARGDKPHPK